MRMRLTLCLLLAGGPLAAQPVDPVERGRELAETICSECHGVGESGVMKDYPPSFWAIARYRDDAQIRARIWSPPAHASMPFYAEVMFPDEVEALVAYIRSLE
ncbi:c-type cytochrome [Oceanibium sediminis]|uniref:c-type cytochrome n=1 Tax=Oceanibium sediminis TaxID=2026339 RepID=UPI000DD2F00B|nr:cytochrome c [Oceanibium sediminis]